jgi:MYXO-CTERM domain-containing protein
MKTCAAGAMLFGGTLGVAQEAQAGLTWTGVRASAYNYTQFETADQTDLNFGTPVFTAGSNFIGFSAATENGWSITASNAGGDELYATNVTNYFTVSSATTVTISGIGFGNTGGAGFFRLLSMTTPQVMLWSNETSPDSTIEVTGPYSSGPITLQAGSYVLTGAVYTTGSFGSSTLFEIAVVPAPGAVALLGMAGLVGRRRRN